VWKAPFFGTNWIGRFSAGKRHLMTFALPGAKKKAACGIAALEVTIIKCSESGTLCVPQ
jgi:hypothetical protein